MKYDVYLSPRSKKQYKKFEKGSPLQGVSPCFRYIKIFHAGVQYRAVYDMAKDKKEVLVIFIGSRENFYKELRRFLV